MSTPGTTSLTGRRRHYNAAIAFESPIDRANADANWVACMSARGYSYTQEGQPRQDLKAQYEADPTSASLRERGVSTAVDDGECIDQSGLVDVKRKGAEVYLAQSATAREEVNQILAEHRRVHASAGAQLAATNEELGVR